jgi:hypothetical protein
LLARSITFLRQSLVGAFDVEDTFSYPAAVTCPVRNLPKWFDASKTALYPAMFAIELETVSFGKTHKR